MLDTTKGAMNIFIKGLMPDRIYKYKDPKTGIPIYSLFGEITKPTSEMLKDLDILIFDIQDVGARFYTFITTLFLTMEAAAEHNLPYIVLDRPNPIRGLRTEGPIREESLRSFVAWPPIPITHGMTVGELAMMANGEGWLKDGEKADLRVVKMEGWDRSLWYDETGLRWTQPSPSMLTLNTAVVYPGACLIEGTNVSEGRGSSRPFEYVGAPWIEPDKLTAALNRMKLPSFRQPFDGGHLMTIGLQGQNGTGSHSLSVQDYGANPTGALQATSFCPREF